MFTIQRTRRRGFTLVELLVVIAIIGILIALLLPAIQAVREAARRLACKNNLKQISTAILSYENTHGAFPPAYRLFSFSDWDKGYNYSIYILPQLEQQPVYDMFTFHDSAGHNYSWDHSINKKASAQHMPIFQCPSASAGREGITDYAACDMIWAWNTQIRKLVSSGQIRERGNNITYADNWKSILMPIIDNAEKYTSSPYMYPHYPNDPSEPMRIEDVTDGLAQSILLPEDVDRPNYWVLGVLQDKKVGAQNWADPDSWYWIHSRSDCRDSAMFNCHNSNEIYSLHPGGAMYAFGDASVHFLGDDLDPEVFVSLFTRSAGDFVNTEELAL